VARGAECFDGRGVAIADDATIIAAVGRVAEHLVDDGEDPNSVLAG
jgi:hypothetical protein